MTTLTDDEIRIAERRWRIQATESLDAAGLATEIERWEQHLDLLRADLGAGDETDFVAATLRAGIAYADVRLRELDRQAARLVRARRPQSPAAKPNFGRARYADLVGLAETLTGQPARRRGKHWVLPCPFHPGDRDPSLVIYLPGRGWHCFGCGRGGQDAASFAAEFFRCTQVEGLRWVEQLCDLPSVA
jgi:hypothetical protein